jgi:murein DD-endopeptidase MepM/ murein hydrolase activator NlpD
MWRPTRGLGAFVLAVLLTGASAQAGIVPARRDVRTVARPSAFHSSVRRIGPTASRSAPSRAAFRPAPSPESRLAEIQQQLAARRRMLARVQREERHVLGQLSWAQERLQKAEAHLRQNAVALGTTRQEVARATQDLRVVSRRLSQHEAMMAVRLREFYEKGPLGYLDVLLGATGWQDFVTRTYLIGLIINRDLRLYQQVASERHQRDEVRATLQAREQQLAAQQQRWRESQAAAAQFAAERRRLLERVSAQRAAQEEAIRELELESSQITELIHRSGSGRRTGPVLTLRDGALLWPVPGRITSGYGWRIHPIFGTREFHTGIDIGAPWGTPIRAAAAGTVLFTGWMRGYGMLVILDHGNGLSTTYSHLSSYLVHVGEHVERGQIIARIGSTGWSTGPHLFFEVRENGRPVDPLGP